MSNWHDNWQKKMRKEMLWKLLVALGIVLVYVFLDWLGVINMNGH